MNRRKDQSVPTSFLMTLLSLVLAGNIFTFAGKLWKQVIGTAMGTRLAPTYACLFMDWLETTKLLGKWKGTQPHLWKRFIDDIFFFWRGTEDELEKFIKHLNTQHPHIKFTATYDIKTKTVPFLDMQVFINEEGFIETDLYKKETARCQYLLPSSCHPGHITKNIPYSLAYRLLRICSVRDTFLKRLEELKQDLLSRSYNAKVVASAFDRVCAITRSDALKRVSRQKSNREPFVLTYHPSLPSVTKMVRKHWEVMVSGSRQLKRCFPQPSVVAYKRSKNLKDMLIRSKVKNTRSSGRSILGFRPCKTVCAMCLNSPAVSSHRCHKTKEE